MPIRQAPKELDSDAVKALLAMSGDDLELQAILKQLETANQLRHSAIGSDSKNAYGAIAQGLAGYGAGKRESDFNTGIERLKGSKKTGRQSFYDMMFPKEVADEQPEQLSGPVDDSPPELLNQYG